MLQTFEFQIDLSMIARALWIEPEQVKKEFSDGRVISRFSEYWASKLYGFEKASNSNEEGFDGYITLNSLHPQKIKVAVRSLTKSGINLCKSIHIGGGRNCNQENLIEALESVEYEIIVDTYNCPTFRIMPIQSSFLMMHVFNGNIKPSGIARKKFLNLINIDNMEIINVSMYENEQNP